MGKKVKRKTYTSKGQRPNVSRAHLKAARPEGDRILNKIAAWRAGKRGTVTVSNPDKGETNRRFIKVSFETYFGGSFKDVMSRIKHKSDTDKVEIKL